MIKMDKVCYIVTYFENLEDIVVVGNENEGIRFHFFDMIYVLQSLSGLKYKL